MISIFLMGKKGLSCLQKIIELDRISYINEVIVSKDLNVQNDYYEDILTLCSKNKIKCFDKNQYHECTSKYLIAISWRWLIPNISNKKLIVFHDSLLPRYRGFAPLVNALINREEKVGVTALIANDEYDKGDIIGQESVFVSYPVKIATVIDLIIPCYQKLIIEIIDSVINNKVLTGSKQNEAQASYSVWLDESDYRINWNNDAEYIKRFIDSVGYPYNCASSYIDGKKIRILDSKLIEDVFIENRHPGKVIFIQNNKPIIICGKGLLQIDSIIDDATKEELLPLKKFRIKFE